MAKIKKPAPKKGEPAKPAPTKKPMRRKSKRVTALPHYDPADVAFRRTVEEQFEAEAPKPGFWSRFRSAVTGLFVPKAVAEANPATTVREKVRK